MEVMNIEKDMIVGSGNYSYKAVSDNQVTLQVKKAEQKFGIVSIREGEKLVDAVGFKESLDEEESS